MYNSLCQWLCVGEYRNRTSELLDVKRTLYGLILFPFINNHMYIHSSHIPITHSPHIKLSLYELLLSIFVFEKGKTSKSNNAIYFWEKFLQCQRKTGWQENTYKLYRALYQVRNGVRTSYTPYSLNSNFADWCRFWYMPVWKDFSLTYLVWSV